MGGECQKETARKPRVEERGRWRRRRNANRPGTLLVADARCAVLRFPLLRDSWPNWGSCAPISAHCAGTWRARRYGRNLRASLETVIAKGPTGPHGRLCHLERPPVEEASFGAPPLIRPLRSAVPRESRPATESSAPPLPSADPPRDTPCRWCTLTDPRRLPRGVGCQGRFRPGQGRAGLLRPPHPDGPD